MFDSCEVPMSELRAIADIHELLDRRRSNAQLCWTPWEAASGWLLNLLAPAGQVFWSVGEYMAFNRSHADTVHALADNKAALSALRRSVRAGRDGGPSFAAHFLLGCLYFFGSRFLPDDLEEDVFLVAQRHEFFFVPGEARAAVTRYFTEQEQVFGEFAFRKAPDDEVVIASRPYPPAVDAALIRPLDLMDQAELDHALGVIEAWSVADERELVMSPLGRALGARGGISMGLLRPVREGVDAQSVIDVARFRSEVSARICSHRIIEQSLVWQLDRSRPQDETVLEALHAMKAELRRVLDEKPIIAEDPFHPTAAAP